MRSPYKYSSILEKPTTENSEHSLTSFYNKLIAPPSLLTIIVGYFFLIQGNDIMGYINNAIAGDSLSKLYLLTILLTLISGFRIVQSLFLAKKDYPDLKSNLFDVIIFVVVILYMAGGIMQVILYMSGSFNQPPLSLSHNSFIVIFIFYGFFALIGTVNFWIMLNYRIPKNSHKYDYPIEKKIQLLNTIVFAYLTISLIISAVLIDRNREEIDKIVFWLISSNFPLLFLNMIHSNVLSYSPKFLIKNSSDSPDNKASEIKKILNLTTNSSDQKILQFISKSEISEFKHIKTERVRKHNLNILQNNLISEFKYIYSYIFQTEKEEKLQSLLNTLLKSGASFGALGYENFYYIIDQKTDKKVGFFKMDTSRRNILYEIIEIFTLPLPLLVKLGPINFLRFIKKVKKITLIQKKPDDGELRLSYIVIFKEYRQQNYGLNFMNLLRNAFLLNNTNNIDVNSITLFTREKNKAANLLFQKSGFKNDSNFNDQISSFKKNQELGKIKRMKLTFVN